VTEITAYIGDICHITTFFKILKNQGDRKYDILILKTECTMINSTSTTHKVTNK